MPLIKTIHSQLSKNTQNIEIALRTIKNEAEIKRARIGEILSPKFQIKSPVNVECFPRFWTMDFMKNLIHRKVRSGPKVFILSFTWLRTFSRERNPLHKICNILESVKGTIIQSVSERIHFCVAICEVIKKDRDKVSPDSWSLGSSATFLWIRILQNFFRTWKFCV